MNTYIRHVKGIRPAATPAGVPIPAEALIFNAPRPIYASHDANDKSLDWIGEFFHGIFYTAVMPDDQRLIELNNDLDAWVLEYHGDEAAIREFVKEYMTKEYPNHPLDWDAFDQHDFDVSFFRIMNQKAGKS